MEANEITNEAKKLLHKLNLQITTVHLDMGGQNRYALNANAHKVIDEIKRYLSKQEWEDVYGSDKKQNTED